MHITDYRRFPLDHKFFCRSTFIVLTTLLVISLVVNAYLYIRLFSGSQTPMRHSTFFSFVFGPTMQNITKGDLCMNLTFDVFEGNLTVKAEVNADSFDPNIFLALQFDSDNNGTIDIREKLIVSDNETIRIYLYSFWDDDSQFLLRSTNETTPSKEWFWAWYSDGTIAFSRAVPKQDRIVPSPFHKCIYDETQNLYTFNFTFPVYPTTFSFLGSYAWLSGTHAILGRFVRVAYGIEPPSTTEKPDWGMVTYVPPFDFTE